MGIVSRSQGGSGTAITRSFSRRVAGDYSLNNVAWTNVDTGIDQTVAAATGDVLMAAVHGEYGSEAVGIFLDACTVVAGSPVNYFSGGTGAAGDFGVTAWSGPSGVTANLGGPAFYTVQAGDIASGNVVVRLRFRCSAAVARTLKAGTSQNFAFFFGVVNLRQ